MCNVIRCHDGASDACVRLRRKSLHLPSSQERASMLIGGGALDLFNNSADQRWEKNKSGHPRHSSTPWTVSGPAAKNNLLQGQPFVLQTVTARAQGEAEHGEEAILLRHGREQSRWPCESARPSSASHSPPLPLSTVSIIHSIIQMGVPWPVKLKSGDPEWGIQHLLVRHHTRLVIQRVNSDEASPSQYPKLPPRSPHREVPLRNAR